MHEVQYPSPIKLTLSKMYNARHSKDSQWHQFDQQVSLVDQAYLEACYGWLQGTAPQSPIGQELTQHLQGIMHSASMYGLWCKYAKHHLQK